MPKVVVGASQKNGAVPLVHYYRFLSFFDSKGEWNMNRVIFVDKFGNKSEVLVSDFCTITIQITDGKVVHTERKESVKMV
ncbi:hypothetical protein [Enterococcus dispar]|uniref:hypothetical protein n=1 Tax=Enterococcus dispar TaxID=44009 RepID=UPI002891FF3B|nr:hypothetical protein [Enterococcus dispar]MDT2705567.1 hypothetical protein [Enterococcus dispar]